MKALVKTAKGPGFVEVRELDIPKIPFPDWVRSEEHTSELQSL
jgi:hypothetical protein